MPVMRCEECGKPTMNPVQTTVEGKKCILCQSCYYFDFKKKPEMESEWQPILWIRRPTGTSNTCTVFTEPDEEGKTHFIGVVSFHTIKKFTVNQIRAFPIKSQDKIDFDIPLSQEKKIKKQNDQYKKGHCVCGHLRAFHVMERNKWGHCNKCKCRKLKIK